VPEIAELRYEHEMARPPKDPIGGSVSGPGSMHLGLRLSKLRAEQLKARVAKANEIARSVGLPDNITPSGLVMLWITRELDVPDSDEAWDRARAKLPPDVAALETAVHRQVRLHETRRALETSRPASKRRRK
jgi:hypothetical protein